MTPKTRRSLAWVACALIPLVFLGSPPVGAEEKNEVSLVQVGTFDYLTQPDFTGLARVGDIAEGQSIGIGTFANLDGELVMVGGSVYQVRPDGVPRAADLSTRTPFMQAIDFRAHVRVSVPPGTQCAQLAPLIQQAAGRTNGIIAVRIRGTFTDLQLRSVTADPPPYQPLSATIAEQTVFPLGQRRAVLVGFWQGRDALGVGQDGLHLHGLSADRRAGGHVLSCVAGPDIDLAVQPVDRVDLRTP